MGKARAELAERSASETAAKLEECQQDHVRETDRASQREEQAHQREQRQWERAEAAWAREKAALEKHRHCISDSKEKLQQVREQLAQACDERVKDLRVKQREMMGRAAQDAQKREFQLKEEVRATKDHVAAAKEKLRRKEACADGAATKRQAINLAMEAEKAELARMELQTEFNKQRRAMEVRDREAAERVVTAEAALEAAKRELRAAAAREAELTRLLVVAGVAADAIAAATASSATVAAPRVATASEPSLSASCADESQGGRI